MDIKAYNQSGKAGGTVALSDALFAAPANADLVYQVATSQISNKRQVLAHGRTRSEVRGGGKKPWRQKGTGRARHGSIRSPIWKGGGVTHGPSKDANFKKTVTTTVARKALAIVLSSRVTEGRFAVIDSVDLTSGKTKDAVKMFSAVSKGLKDYTKGGRILFVLPGTKEDAPALRAVSNLPRVDAYRASDLNALIALSYPFVVATKDAVGVMEKTFKL